MDMWWHSGWHSGEETIFGVVHMVLGSWWEIIENGDRGSTQNFDTNLVSIVVWPGEPFWKKCVFWPYFQGYRLHFPGACSQNRFFPQMSPDSKELLSISRFKTESTWLVFQYFSVQNWIKITWVPVFLSSKLNQNDWFSNISRFKTDYHR